MQKIAWIGLGVMGYPMSGFISQQEQYEVCVYNRTPQKSADWVAKYDGTYASTPAEAAHGADFILACVGNDEDLREVTLGEKGAFSELKPGAIFIDHTTTSANIARELSNIASSKAAHFLDAPVSGGQVGAETGQLTVMVGGVADIFRTALPVMECYSKSVKHIGDCGAGQLAKMVNQICIAGVVQGLSEAIHFAEKAGLDVPAVIETISKGAAQSWQMENRWQTMNQREFNHGFAVDWMRKDLGFCLDEARKNGANLPLTALVDQFYSEVQDIGGNRWDTSSLIARLDKSTKA